MNLPAITGAYASAANPLDIAAASGLPGLMEFISVLEKNSVLPATFYGTKPERKGNATVQVPDRTKFLPGNALMIIQATQELGIGFLEACANLYFVNGRLAMQSDLMISRARAAGHDVRHIVNDANARDMAATTRIVRREKRDAFAQVEDRHNERMLELLTEGMGAEEAEKDPALQHLQKMRDQLAPPVTWTNETATKAGLLASLGEKSPWRLYRRAMLRHRADAEAVRMTCPEVLGGIKYTPEELGALVREDGAPTQGSYTVERADTAREKEQASLKPATPSREVAVRPAAKAPATVSEGDDDGRAKAQEIFGALRSATGLAQLGEMYRRAEELGVLHRVVRTPSGNTKLRNAFQHMQQHLKNQAEK